MSGQTIDSSALLGAVGRIPRKVATCPECNRTLRYDVTAEDEDGNVDVDFDCGAPMKTRDGHWTHRYWQSDWQDVVDKCRAWVKAHAPNQVVRGATESRTSPPRCSASESGGSK